MVMKTCASAGISMAGAMRPSSFKRWNSDWKPCRTKLSTARWISATRGLRVELHADLDAEQALVGWLLGKILVAEALQRLEEIRGLGKLGQALGELCALALADAGDQRFLAVEIEVERTGADRGLLADVLHGGAVESGAGEAAFGGVEDVLAAGALDVRL